MEKEGEKKEQFSSIHVEVMRKQKNVKKSDSDKIREFEGTEGRRRRNFEGREREKGC